MRDLSGSGILKVHGKELGPVRFELSIYEEGPIAYISCSGKIMASATHIHAAFNAQASSIVRDDTGDEMKFVVTRHGFDGEADVEVSSNPGT